MFKFHWLASNGRSEEAAVNDNAEEKWIIFGNCLEIDFDSLLVRLALCVSVSVTPSHRKNTWITTIRFVVSPPPPPSSYSPATFVLFSLPTVSVFAGAISMGFSINLLPSRASFVRFSRYSVRNFIHLIFNFYTFFSLSLPSILSWCGGGGAVGVVRSVTRATKHSRFAPNS